MTGGITHKKKADSVSTIHLFSKGGFSSYIYSHAIIAGQTFPEDIAAR